MLVSLSLSVKAWHVCLVLGVNPAALCADSRTENWFLMSSPLPQTIVIAIYIYFVTSLGPRIMENRKPLDLKGVLIFYNFSVVALSVYMIYEVSQSVHSRCLLLVFPHLIEMHTFMVITFLYCVLLMTTINVPEILL